jgi:hypothetical protein
MPIRDGHGTGFDAWEHGAIAYIMDLCWSEWVLLETKALGNLLLHTSGYKN